MSIKINAMQTCYISGKISGLSKTEYTRNFDEAKAIVTLGGFTAVSPLDLYCPINLWIAYMIVDIIVLSFCDCVYFMDNWSESRGARIEYGWAKYLRKEVIEL